MDEHLVGLLLQPQQSSEGANNDNDSNADVEEIDAIRLRLEQEMDQQTLP